MGVSPPPLRSTPPRSWQEDQAAFLAEFARTQGYGQIVLKIHHGQVVQVDKTESRRYGENT